ncbi:tetratricopeptide repeat protein [Agathobacter sp.]|uniref:tetratricopeptide repeat protein n=1 Tax=Agathobacter sp. TaxID=2021311 RepID=UPI002A90B9A0|nr:tetratricopeptide repeat protein [Agathobacter sp.]MDY5861919.1 tetratricopeptide repeat protein [Agathobacter sp.]
MDKYEYNLKLDQIKALSAEEGYMSAAEIADSINWNKIKNVNTLVKIGEIYEKAERYQDARDILLMAYDRSPIGRMIIYRLAEVAIKMGDYDAATEYYDEFVEIAPHDDMKYVLRYAIKKGQGASFDELIAILEELKEEEYTEEWAYELAYLYHKAGKVDKCVEACDELILWFGDGPYVERALELKMLYQPLTKTQEEKYRQFKLEKENISRENKKEAEPESETDEDELTEIGAMEMVKGGEIVHDDVKIPQITVNQEKFNTVNLQEEIAKGMKQIMDAKGKNEVADTMDNIKKIVEEIPFLKFLKDKDDDKKSEQPSDEEQHIATDEEIDSSLRMNFKELLGEDSDGQMSMVINEKTQLEHQITGQMSIQDVLDEWEKTKRAAETALNEANQQKLESAKARALQEAGDIMERLNDVIPKLDAGATPKELLENEYMQGIEIPKVQEPVQKSVEEPQPETQETVEEPQPEAQEPVEEPQPETQEIVEEPQSEIPEAVEAFDGELEDAIVAEESEEAEILAQPTMLMPEITDDMLKNEEADEEPEQEPEKPRDFEHVTSFIEQEIAKMAAKNPGIEKKLEMAKTRKMPNLSLPEDLDSEEDDKTVIESKHINELTNEQRAIFSYFIPVKGMENQICKAYNGIIDHLNKKGNASSGNLIIQGEQGCGKTMLATSFVKVLQKVGHQSTGKLGKIDASALNKKDAQQILRKIAGGCLIIERAGDIDRNTAVQLSFLMDHDITGTLYILEDTSKGIKRALSMDEGFAAKFTEKISVPIFTNDELVLFAKSYSTELGYKIDEMAILALHNRISNIERIDQATTLTEVKEIIDEAIDREAHSGLKKAISILTAKRYTDDDRIVLREDHFKEK